MEAGRRDVQALPHSPCRPLLPSALPIPLLCLRFLHSTKSRLTGLDTAATGTPGLFPGPPVHRWRTPGNLAQPPGTLREELVESFVSLQVWAGDWPIGRLIAYEYDSFLALEVVLSSERPLQPKVKGLSTSLMTTELPSICRVSHHASCHRTTPAHSHVVSKTYFFWHSSHLHPCSSTTSPACLGHLAEPPPPHRPHHPHCHTQD